MYSGHTNSFKTKQNKKNIKKEELTICSCLNSFESKLYSIANKQSQQTNAHPNSNNNYITLYSYIYLQREREIRSK